LNLGTSGLNVTNGLWTNKDAGGLGAGENFERNIGFSGDSGSSTFSGSLQLNGSAVFRATPAGTLVMAGEIRDGTDNSAGVRHNVLVNALGTILLSGPNTYTGFTEIDAGTLVIRGSAQNPLLNGPGFTDIRGGRLVFDYSGGGTDPIATILPLLQTSLASNFTAGQFRVGNAVAGIGIGYVDDPTGQRLQLIRTYLGDSNFDGNVNALDFNTLANNYGATTGAGWVQGDFNYDGAVDSSDFNYVATNFNASLGAAPASSLGALVPEPISLSILPVGALLLLGTRARRRRFVH
jgi:autotransporter-associated beta strand protein